MTKQNISEHRFYQNGTCFGSLKPSSDFIGKCNYIKLPPQCLWDNTSLHNNSRLLFLALQSLADGKLLPQLPSVFSVLRLTYPVPYTCKSLFMLGCLCCFHVVFQASERSHTFFMGWGCQPHAQPQTWGTRVSHLAWVITLTCLAWEALLVATLLLAKLSGSFDHASPTTTSK